MTIEDLRIALELMDKHKVTVLEINGIKLVKEHLPDEVPEEVAQKMDAEEAEDLLYWSSMDPKGRVTL